MNETEMTTAIGEVLSMEMDDVHNIKYQNETSFILIMENGKRFQIDIKELT